MVKLDVYLMSLQIIFIVCKRLLEICCLVCLNPNKLKLTDNRVADKTFDGAKTKDFECDVKNELGIEDELTSNISASLEDLKGECDGCDIPVNNIHGELHRRLPSSQTSNFTSYQKEAFLEPLSRRNSDSVLCKVHKKLGKCELQLEQEGCGTVGMSETKTNCETNDDLETAISTQNKKIDMQHFSHELNEANPVDSLETYTKVELAAMAFASDSEMDDEIMAKVHMLQVSFYLMSPAKNT